MPTPSANLVTAVEDLERTLAAQGSECGAGRNAPLDQALARVEAAVREHVAMLQKPNMDLVEVDRPRLPSPAVDRKVHHLCEELEQLLGEIQAMRSRLQSAGAPATQPDCGMFVHRARQLAAALEHYGDEEAHLILESVNLDLGAGD